MDIGDVYLPADRRINDHPRVVISHPELNPEEVVVVNFTSADEFYKDLSCVLTRDDYPEWIKHDTCISYRDAKLVCEGDVDELTAKGKIKQLPPVSDAVITKILDGAAKTEDLPGKCRRVLERQGLIGT